MSVPPGSPEQRMISVRGAREHNLMDVNVDLPRDQLVVITGLSDRVNQALHLIPFMLKARAICWMLSAYAPVSGDDAETGC